MLQALDLNSCIGLRSSAGDAIASLTTLKTLLLPDFAEILECPNNPGPGASVSDRDCEFCAAKNSILVHLTGVYKGMGACVQA